MNNIIHGIDDSHRKPTSKTFRRYGYDPRVGLITVLIHPEDVRQDVDADSLIVTPPASNAWWELQEVFPDLIVDYHHLYESILELRYNQLPILDWSNIQLPVYLILRSNDCSFSSMYIMKKRNLFNTNSSTVLNSTSFLQMLPSVVTYARIFN